MATQGLDDVMGVYMAIVEDTIQRCRNIQNGAVLDQVRQRWMANLHERIKQPNQVKAAQNVAGDAKLPVKGHLGFNKVKIKVKADLDDNPVPLRQSISDVFASDKLSRLPLKSSNAPIDTDSGLWNNPQKKASPVSRPCVDQEPEPIHDDEVIGEEDDEWGDWEDPDAQKDGDRSARVEAPANTPQQAVQQAETLQPQVPEEGYVDAQGNYIPTEADFATRVTTQYGRGNPMLNGSNALHWTKPDEIDSDLDNVSDLSDDEPEARDSVVGQFEAVVKPTGRKATSSGLWKIKVRNGIAKVNNQEFFFDALCADLIL